MDKISEGILNPEPEREIVGQQKRVMENPVRAASNISPQMETLKQGIEKGKIGPESVLWQEAEKFLNFAERDLGTPIEELTLYKCLELQRLALKENETEYLSMKNPPPLFKSDFDLAVLFQIALKINELKKREAH